MLLILKEELQAIVMELAQCKVSSIDGIDTKFYKEHEVFLNHDFWVMVTNVVNEKCFYGAN
jgi:hypothetical protein